MLRRLLLPAALAAVLAAGGCGGGSGDKGSSTTSTTVGAEQARAYKLTVQGILRSVGTAGRSLVVSVRAASSLSDVARALAAFRASVDQAAVRLDASRAPPTAAAGQRHLSRTLREIAAGTAPTIRAARAGDRPAFRREFLAYQRKLNGVYRVRLRAAGDEIDRALARP
ncbi:MAG: hypothetical protein QOE65_1336 [Solirubrobacteraceae bacterium]|jgi:hypothetical protein|nr:hypothetical protein [Solirubrobacteraceae bacterium]